MTETELPSGIPTPAEAAVMRSRTVENGAPYWDGRGGSYDAGGVCDLCDEPYTNDLPHHIRNDCTYGEDE